MYSAAVENITLFGGIVQYSIKSETFGACLQVQQCMLLVSDTDNTFIPTLVFMRHHGPDSECDFDPLAADIRHHRIPIEGIHLTGDISGV